MKDRSKKYLLVFSLLGVVVLGGLFAKSITDESASLSDESTPFTFVSSSIVTPDVSVYSQASAAIIVGTVKGTTDHPNQTDTPYTRTVLDAQIEVEEVLKGDPDMTNLNVMMMLPSENEWIEDNATLVPGERVLLFLAMDLDGNYRIFAGNAGKCLIDKEDNVINDWSVFTMPLADLKIKIHEALLQPTITQ